MRARLDRVPARACPLDTSPCAQCRVVRVSGCRFGGFTSPRIARLASSPDSGVAPEAEVVAVEAAGAADAMDSSALVAMNDVLLLRRGEGEAVWRIDVLSHM